MARAAKFVGVLMVLRPRSRPGSAFPVIFVLAVLLIGPSAASADPLDDAACQRLRSERQALTLLGIDKQVEKGADWAKASLTVADLNLVKRYLDVSEQLKFRCDKIVAVAEPEEKDDDDDDDDAASPPLPERKAVQPAKAPAVLPQIKLNGGAKPAKAPLGAANASAAPIGPPRAPPAR
jgi:hypothetical protein